MEQPNYYSILPANVRYDKELKANEKLLFSEITALANKQGYCHAWNSYFADLYGVSKTTISNWINHLKERGYLKIVTIKDGKEIKKRKLYPNDTPVEENDNTTIKEKFNTPSKNDGEGIKEKLKSPIKENFKENITSINNTSKNNMLNDARHTFRDVHNLWESNWGFPNGIAEQDLTEWTKKYGADLVMHVITYALRRNINSKGADRYLARTFEQYDKQSIKTVEQAERSEKQHEQQMSREYQSMGGRRRPVHADPVKKDYTPPKGFDR